MEWQNFINITAGAAFACFGWFLRTMYDAVQCLKRSIHDLEIEVTGKYVKKDELKEVLDRIDHRFDKMETLIGRLFDKMEAKQDRQ